MGFVSGPHPFHSISTSLYSINQHNSFFFSSNSKETSKDDETKARKNELLEWSSAALEGWSPAITHKLMKERAAINLFL